MENVFDPAAAAFDSEGSWRLRARGRQWGLTIVCIPVGGAPFALVFAVEGTISPGTREVLTAFAEEAVHRTATTWFASAIAGGALVTLPSSLRVAVNGVGARMALASMVGVLLALGPFDHVIVTAIHVVAGLVCDAPVGRARLRGLGVAVVAGNPVGGLRLVTLTHLIRAMVSRENGN
jgi:formate/nitrite transporter FocA (FNT family)